MKNDQFLTADDVRRLFNYDPLTGAFTYATGFKLGKQAGNFDPEKGYWRVRIKGRPYYVHRLIWLHAKGRWPVDQTDHINGNRSDNRLSNLREADRVQNSQNQKLYVNSKSGLKGVRWHKTAWVATITIKKKSIHLGSYSDPVTAHQAYRKAAVAEFGEFARFE